MALDPNATKLANLIDPQVLADLIDKKLVDAMKFSPLATIDTTLVGRPGSTVSLPSFNYIGDSTVIAEGADIPIAQLTATMTPVSIHKIGRGTQLTDESVLSGFGDPMGEAAKQLALMDNDNNSIIKIFFIVTSPPILKIVILTCAYSTVSGENCFLHC